MDFSKSKCRGSYLHKFANVQATLDGVLERCVKAGCGVKHVVKLVNGQPNVVEYARYHMREFLIPQHRLFHKEFSKIKKTRYA